MELQKAEKTEFQSSRRNKIKMRMENKLQNRKNTEKINEIKSCF